MFPLLESSFFPQTCEKPVRFVPMKERITNLWRPVKKMMITPLENNTFLFQLFNQLDVDRAMSDGPWSFDNHMLALRRISHGEDPNAVPVHTVKMWVTDTQLTLWFHVQGHW
jgi:14-3-3 protein epsilon